MEGGVCESVTKSSLLMGSILYLLALTLVEILSFATMSKETRNVTCWSYVTKKWSRMTKLL